MTEKRIQFSNIVHNQLPSYVKEEFPLVEEFLSQYYISQEFQGAPVDLIQNIDSYIKLDQVTNQVNSVILLNDISPYEDTILINLEESPSGTTGFPEKYGLLKIDDEIVTYTGKTFSSFTGCIRGFSGISSYISQNQPDQLVFSQTKSAEHSTGSTINNLSSLFLKEFLLKIKHQLTPGFENRQFIENLDESLFIKQSKDFYRSKGTDESFKILFKSLYGENVEIIKPKEYLFRPSDSQFQITKDLVVESIEGNPENLENSTLFQDEYDNFTKAYAPISKVEKIRSKEGKDYYKLSIDANYDRDIRVDGALYGEFKSHPQTKIIGNYNSNSTVIDVDSTVGFPESGELSVIYNDGSLGLVSYTSKNLTQFFDCTNITGIIEDSSSISLNVFAYGNSFINQNEIIKVRITSVLTGADLISDTFYLKEGYESNIKTLGVNPNDVVSNNWFFNLATEYEVESISLIDNSSSTYKINTTLNHIFRVGDKLSIKNSVGVEKESVIIDVLSEKSIIISQQGILLENDNYTIKRHLLKTDSSRFPSASVFNTNVQNVYKDNDKTLVASSSLPYYAFQSLEIIPREIIFGGTFESDEFTIVSSGDHGFYSGDAVYYTPQKTENEILSKLFDEGIYYIYRVNEKAVKFALSRSDIYNSKFISIDNPITVVSNKIELFEFKDKTLSSQKLLREISSPVNDGGTYITKPGFTGILINGVEILNYKSRDAIYYGKLDKVEVISPGNDYDIINPPVLTISDSVGTGASAFCAVNGSLSEIRIIDPGFDYMETPVVKITGGNGIGAKAFANMKLVDHESQFNSEINSAQVSITQNSIGFTTYHKFRNAEKVIYNVNGQRGVGGLSTGSSYYVSVQSPTEIKLHKSLNDAVTGINTVQLTSFGIGNHSLKSFDKKSVLGSINIQNSGSGYENKKRTVSSNIIGINTSINQINIPNHDFKTGEIIKYSSNGTEIGGLVNNNEYYVTVIDDNSFKLSQIGVGSQSKNFLFNTKQFVEFTSIGSGIHTFNYPEISVEIIGNVGGLVQFKAVVQPIFRGEITSVHLESGGVGYGSSEILNYNRQPTFRLNSGSGAQVTPIISNGRIVEVLVNSSGKDYNSPPNLEIIGDGIGAVLTPVIENGKLVEVKVIESGIGYSADNTLISLTASGSLAEFFADIQIWNVNLFKKSLSSILSDDGILSGSLNEEYGLQYAHLYAPRKLREIIYANDSDGNILYGKRDLIKLSNSEISSSNHSPIIGWAYDGNPIYGPYGYSSRQGGTITQMKSGYKIDIKPNRPSLNNFAEGFFVEDYSHFNISDETVLDEYNGRFCVTPEFPNGTYAYFATISDLGAETSPFSNFYGYKEPIFPFFIGNKFKSRPNEFNFKKSSNQDEVNLNETNWSRNTTPYNLIENEKSYSYLELPNNLNQTIDIKFASAGSVEETHIIFGGANYRVKDKLIFDNEGTKGYSASAEVERISGKFVNSISVASTSIFNVEFYPSGNSGEFLLFAETPHNLQNQKIINVSGFNTTSSLTEGFYRSGISTNSIVLTSGVGNTSVTGIITYFSVAGNLNYPNIRENDIFSIGSERIKILNVDRKSSRIRVLREVDGTVGSAHSITEVLYEVPRKLTINSGIKTQYNFKINRELYFQPSDSVGLGTISGVGIGSTIVFSNPGVGITQIFIPTRSIYIPNHQLETGDELIYSIGDGFPIGVSTNGISTSVTLSDQSIVYVSKFTDDLIGISTFRVGLGTDGTFVGLTSETNNYGLLYFTNLGSGDNHSFKTTYETLVGNISKNIVTVSTAQSHGLLNNDTVFIDVNPSIATTVVIKYDDFNRKILVNPKDFEQSDVDISKNIITIKNHEFISGQKVLHTSSLPSIGLENNKEYFIVIVDENNIKLTNTYYDALNPKPNIVGISSASFGTLSKINPQINAYKDSNLIFEVSDSSLGYVQQSFSFSAFDLRFFKDSNFTESYITNGNNSLFDIQKVGSIGVTTDAKIILKINENTPENLYYTLVPIYDGNLPETKKLINVDTEVIGNNQINIGFSQYNGQYDIISTSSTTFTYNLPVIPENTSYNSNTSKITYETNSSNTSGSISKVKLLNNGQNYYSLPLISSVNSLEGNGAIIELSSTSIGKVKKTRLNDIGFNFPVDFTLKPSLSIPQVIKVDPLSSLDFIEVISFGRGYTTAPKLLVIDGKTNQVLPEVDLKFTLGNDKVEILENTFALNSTTPIILPIQNSNGVGISSIYYNEFSKDVTVTLSIGFSTATSFPFEVDDKVLIENIGITSEGKGFNSENYNYQLFTITSIDPNIGGEFGSVTYNLSEFLSGSETPGEFNSDNSLGRIIPQKYFPNFNILLKKNNYLIGEEVISQSAKGIVEDWEPKTNFVKILSKDNFKTGDLIKGLTSRTQGIGLLVSVFDAFLNVGSLSRFENGWKTSAGFLNDNIQRIQDSLYYQNFSYSLKSKVDYDIWNDAVSTLNHTSGFKKFSDYQLESSVGISSASVKPTNDLTSVETITDIVSVMDLNCVYDFDLVRENSITINNRILSDEIIFANKILTDYSQSIGNRVLTIDNISPQFNSNPRPTRFSEVDRFNLADIRSQKYIAYITDRRFFNDKQLLVATTLIDDLGNTYLNQYGRIESNYDMGSFDLAIDNLEGVLRFYPTKFEVNDYFITTLSYNINDDLLSVGNTSFGGVIDIQSQSTLVSSGSTTIVSFGSTYRACKLLISISSDDGKYEFDELTLIHDGTNVELLEYGQLTNHSVDSFSNTGLGTYYPYIFGSQVNVDFIPNIGIAATINSINVLFSGSLSNLDSFSSTLITFDSTNYTFDNNGSYSIGIGTHEMKHALLEGRFVSIASSSSPSAVQICEYADSYEASYLIIQSSDITNNIHQISEVTILDNDYDVFFTEYGILNTLSGIGTIGAYKTPSSVVITFTPLPNIETNVKVYLNALKNEDDEKDVIDFINSEIQTNHAVYEGTERDIKRSFNLTYKNDPIFEKYFNAENSSIVSIASSSIIIPNHFLVTGELINYYPDSNNPEYSIGIGTTSFAGIGLTDKLPNEVFVVKLDENTIQLARNADDALKTRPKVLDITSVGIGTLHKFVSTNQNSKVLVAIDNIIQSPIVSTSTTTTLISSVVTTDDIIYFSDTDFFFNDDLIRIEDEIMRIESVGVGTINAVRVIRPWMGTSLSGYSTGTLVTKVTGQYNIVDNVINFVSAPYGNVPLSSTTNPPEEVDWEGLQARSTFQGRSFIRSGILNSTEETYSKNYIFDSIATEFNGFEKEFKLTSNGNDVSGIKDDNAIILINDIFQGPGLTNDYTLNESLGITSISFTGSASSVSYDVNATSIPRGGIIVSVGSTKGFGYQPLVAAGGTAIVSIAGTISSISIGNSGSGYREGIQVVNVGVFTSNTGTPNIEFIGTATVSNGHIVSIAITNPGTGYTSTNPPYVIFDDPLSYSNIPLIYSSSSSGVGTEAKINVVVGQGSSVIDFEIVNNGYAYRENEVLTIPVGGLVGIPTTGLSFEEFKIIVQRTNSDKFSGLSIGELQVLDKLDSKFNGTKTRFSLTLNNIPFSIVAPKGSNIDVQSTILVFINDILQVPGESYIFNGGSSIRFIEAPKIGDTSKIIFYRGTKGVDVVDVNLLETVKVGDNLTIGYDSSIGQSPILQEDFRTVTNIDAVDVVNTNPYFGPGNTDDENLLRPVVWCRQTEDKIINEQDISKDRMLYEAVINPTSYVIKSVGIGSTVIFVDNVRPFFNQLNENQTSLEFQNKVTFIPQEVKVGAFATAIVSVAGTISSIDIENGGIGYETNPTVTIQSFVGVNTASAVSSTVSGIVTSIQIINPGLGYTSTNPPLVLIEPPVTFKETNDVDFYEGDFGYIIGISTGSVGVASTALIFDLYIPQNSSLRDSSIAGVTTISGIQTGYYFVVNNSNIGNPTTSLDFDGNIIGIGNTFIDNVYQVSSVSIAQTSVTGVGVTYISRVVVSVNNYDSVIGIDTTKFIGEYSWGRIKLKNRTKNLEYNAYTYNGVTGLTTSTILTRTNSLRFSNYIS